MVKRAPGEVDQLRRDAERALRANLDVEELLPLLAQLARAAEPDSEEWIFANRHLAEIGVEHDPWRAALLARAVIARRPEDDGAWAVLGLSQSLLGHHRYASHAYERALALAPDNPWYAHNLGHLYDVALDRPKDALPLLERAALAQPGEGDIAASYAHALARCGRLALAKRVLRRAIRRGGTADQMALWRWLEAGAPADWKKGRERREGTASGAGPRTPAAPEPRQSSPAAAVERGATLDAGASGSEPVAPLDPESGGGAPAGESGRKKPRRKRAREGTSE